MTESATDRLARLLALVPWLRAHDGITISEAAEHFGVEPEQLTTDLWQLIVCGIPGYGPDQLVDIQFWDDDRIHVIDAIGLDRPLRLTGEEVAALQVALRVLAQVPGGHDRRTLVSVMAKLEEAGAPQVPITVNVAIDPKIRDTVTMAIHEQRWLRIEYAAADEDQITERRIRPHDSFAIDDRVYLHAWCDVAADVRTFRLDRIHTAEVTKAPESEMIPQITAARTHAPTNFRVARIAIDPLAAWILDTEDVEALSDADAGAPEALVRYASLDWLVRWTLGLGGRVRLLDPPEARDAVRAAALERLASS